MSQYEFLIEPIGYVRRTRADSWKKRPCVLRYYAYKDHLRWLAKQQGYALQEVLHIEFHLPIPKSLSLKKQKALHLTPHTKKPDLDNLIKAFLDSLTDQDNFVHTIYATKKYSLTPKIIVKNVIE